MERRKFIGTAGAGMAGILAAGSAPAFAQGGRESSGASHRAFRSRSTPSTAPRK